MKKGKVKMFFPGGNTSRGFYSFYDYIIDREQAQRVFILKGGPGVGKSTFMKKIGEELQSLGFDLEYHWCSSDSDSLDAVVVPTLKVALIDGTAPHVVDPRYPGAVDEIVHFGGYWDDAKLKSSRDEIISLNKMVGQQFTTVYRSLQLARVAREEERGCREKGLKSQEFHRLLGDIFRQIFKQEITWGEGCPRERHLFAWALTPKGIVHHLPTILDDLRFLYLIQGDPGSGKEIIFQELAELGYRSGFSVEVYHCAFDPALIDMVVLPDLKTAVINTFPELPFDFTTLPNLKYMETIECNICLDLAVLKNYERELRETGELFLGCFKRGLHYLQEARRFYQELEQYYSDAVDFEGLKRKRDDVLTSILEYEVNQPNNQA